MHGKAPLPVRLPLRTERLLRRWRSQRRALNALLEDSAFPQASRPGALPLERRVGLLRHALLDYLSAGHFAVYARLLDEHAGAGRAGEEPLRSLYLMIESTTDHALQFHDKYDTDSASLLAEPRLPRDLSQLRRVMRMRFQLEEQWIEWVVTGGEDGEDPE